MIDQEFTEYAYFSSAKFSFICRIQGLMRMLEQGINILHDRRNVETLAWIVSYGFET